jgi:Na+:H+ antiporter
MTNVDIAALLALGNADNNSIMGFSQGGNALTAFLYLGISMNLIDIAQHFPIITLSLIAVFGARAATIYPLLAATTRFARENIPNTWKHIVLVGGMRGAISVALVASLPPSEFKNILQTITFGVVLLSLIIQYVVLSGYVKRVFPEAQQNGSRW